MRKNILAFVFLISSVTAFAQAQLEAKAIQLNLQTAVLATGLAYVGADYGITNRWSAGGEVTFRRFLGANGVRIAGVANYRVNDHNKFGVYLGLLMGYDIYGTKKHEISTPYGPLTAFETTGLSSLAIGGQLGLRYFFTDKLGAFFQLGAGNFLESRLGITYKL